DCCQQIRENMGARQNMDLTGSHSQRNQNECTEKTFCCTHRLVIHNSPCQHDRERAEQNNAVQAKPIIYRRKHNLRKPLMRKTWITGRAERKDIRGGNVVSLLDQIPGQDVTRQVSVKIKDSGSISNNPPKDRDK